MIDISKDIFNINGRMEITDIPKIYVIIKNFTQIITRLYIIMQESNFDVIKTYLNKLKQNFPTQKILQYYDLDKNLNIENFKLFFDDVSINNLKNELRIMNEIILIYKSFLNEENKKTLGTKELLEQLINNYNKWYDISFKWNVIIKNDPTTEVEKKINSFFSSLNRLKQNKISFQLININEKLIKDFVIFDLEYFNKIIAELNLIYGTENTPSIFNNLIEIIKELATSDGVNDIKNNLFYYYKNNDKSNLDSKIKEINILIDQLVKDSQQITLLPQPVKEEVKKYLKTKGLKLPEYNNKYQNFLLTLISQLKKLKQITNEPTSASLLMEISLELLKNERIRIFQDIISEEGLIINSIGQNKELGLINKLNIDISKNVQIINQIINYKLPDENIINKLKQEQANQETIKKLNELITMDNYLSKDNKKYEDAKAVIEKCVNLWKEIMTTEKDEKGEPKSKLFEKSTPIKEKEKILNEKMKPLLENLFNFHQKFFLNILDFTADFKFKTVTKDEKYNLSILSNEIIKIFYFKDLLENLKLLDNENKTTKLQSKIDSLTKNKLAKIETLSNHKEFIEKNSEQIFEQKYLKIDFNDKEKESENEENIKKFIKKINDYFNTLKEIGKIVDDFRLKADDFKQE